MNKNQSAGMYIILAIVVLVFVSSVFMAGPTTSTSEISYSSFTEKLANKEFKKIEIANDYLIAVPVVQPQAEQTTEKTSFGVVPVNKVPQVQYKVLTPNAPDLMSKIEQSGAAHYFCRYYS